MRNSYNNCNIIKIDVIIVILTWWATIFSSLPVSLKYHQDSLILDNLASSLLPLDKEVTNIYLFLSISQLFCLFFMPFPIFFLSILAIIQLHQVNFSCCSKMILALWVHSEGCQDIHYPIDHLTRLPRYLLCLCVPWDIATKNLH